MKEWIYGKNTIREALENGRIKDTVYFLEGTKDEKIMTLCKKQRIDVKFQAKSFFQRHAPQARTQGIMAQVDGYAYTLLEDLVARLKNKSEPLLIMLDGLEDPHNLGAILRTADAIGADGVIIGKNRSVSLNSTVAKVSTGAIEHIPVCQVTNLARTLEALKKEGYWVVGTDMKDAVDYRQPDYSVPLVLVVGSEGFGISRLVLEKCDFKVHLPMRGHVTSLNASVACAIMLYAIDAARHPLS